VQFEEDTRNVQLFLGLLVEVSKRSLLLPRSLLCIFLGLEVLAEEALNLCGKDFLFMDFELLAGRTILPYLDVVNKMLLNDRLPVVLLNYLVDLLLLLTEEPFFLLETVLPHADVQHHLLAEGPQGHWGRRLLESASHQDRDQNRPAFLIVVLAGEEEA